MTLGRAHIGLMAPQPPGSLAGRVHSSAEHRSPHRPLPLAPESLALTLTYTPPTSQRRQKACAPNSIKSKKTVWTKKAERSKESGRESRLSDQVKDQDKAAQCPKTSSLPVRLPRALEFQIPGFSGESWLSPQGLRGLQLIADLLGASDSSSAQWAGGHSLFSRWEPRLSGVKRGFLFLFRRCSSRWW